MTMVSGLAFFTSSTTRAISATVTDGPQGITPAALDIGHPGSLYRRRNGIKIDVSVRGQLLHLEGHAPLLEAAMAFSPETYHLFQGIIGASGEGHNGIPGPQHAEQRCGEGMGAGYEVVADQGVLTAEDVCQYRIQGFPSRCRRSHSRWCLRTWAH